MEVTGLFIYPIKGLGGISLEKALPFERGLQHDRRWMLVDKQNRFLTQREFSEFARFKQNLHEDSLDITFQNETISIPFDESAYKTSEIVQVWNDEVPSLIADDTINNWFSNKLNAECKLVYQGEQSIRLTNPKYNVPKQVSYADGYPYLLLSEESLAFLNNQLEAPIKMDRFRPNIVIKGGHAHCEDQFELLNIGEFQFRGVKPCARCQVITIDQKTGIQGKEPLKTLQSYRRIGNKILFGQNLIIEKGEKGKSIEVGNAVLALKEKVQNN